MVQNITNTNTFEALKDTGIDYYFFIDALEKINKCQKQQSSKRFKRITSKASK